MDGRLVRKLFVEAIPVSARRTPPSTAQQLPEGSRRKSPDRNSRSHDIAPPAGAPASIKGRTESRSGIQITVPGKSLRSKARPDLTTWTPGIFHPPLISHRKYHSTVSRTKSTPSPAFHSQPESSSSDNQSDITKSSTILTPTLIHLFRTQPCTPVIITTSCEQASSHHSAHGPPTALHGLTVSSLTPLSLPRPPQHLSSQLHKNDDHTPYLTFNLTCTSSTYKALTSTINHPFNIHLLSANPGAAALSRIFASKLSGLHKFQAAELEGWHPTGIVPYLVEKRQHPDDPSNHLPAIKAILHCNLVTGQELHLGGKIVLVSRVRDLTLSPQYFPSDARTEIATNQDETDKDVPSVHYHDHPPQSRRNHSSYLNGMVYMNGTHHFVGSPLPEPAGKRKEDR